MAFGRLHHQVINATGEVVGAVPSAPWQVALHGWAFSNSGAATYAVNFYTPPDPAVGSGQQPAQPAATGNLIFTVQVPAGSSKEFVFPDGVIFKDGLFAVASNVAVTGVVFYS